VAATATGLAWCRFLLLAHSEVYWSDVWDALSSGDTSRWNLSYLWLASKEAARLVSPLLLAWSAAIVVSRLRSPRPRRRRLWCQPGFLACLATLFVYGWRSIGFVVFLIPYLVAVAGKPAPVDTGALATELAVLFSYRVSARADAGGAVALAWLVVAAGGRWLPEPTWVDRAGRVLGVAWLILTIATSPAMFG
jgi:hypothetical protein